SKEPSAARAGFQGVGAHRVVEVGLVVEVVPGEVGVAGHRDDAELAARAADVLPQEDRVLGLVVEDRGGAVVPAPGRAVAAATEGGPVVAGAAEMPLISGEAGALPDADLAGQVAVVLHPW